MSEAIKALQENGVDWTLMQKVEREIGEAFLNGQNSVLGDIHRKLYLGEGTSWGSIDGRIKELHEAEGRAAKLAEEKRQQEAELERLRYVANLVSAADAQFGHFRKLDRPEDNTGNPSLIMGRLAAIMHEAAETAKGDA